MKILAIGDIVGSRAVEHLEKNLWSLRRELNIDMVIANGENASEIHGLSAKLADDILDAGVDLITMGNHTWAKRDLYNYLDDNTDKIIRPANYPGNAPGVGFATVNINGYRLLCINVLGQAFMDPVGDPFDAVEYVLEREEGEFDISLLDIHAEATSEKYAIARYFDGKIDIIFGTHTHVPTADLRILPGGTAYVTDLGMTGPDNGILGTDTDRVLTRMKMHMPAQFIVADGKIEGQAVLFTLDSTQVTALERITF